MSVRDRIESHLLACGNPYSVLDHPYADTASTIAAARGTPLSQGVKSILFKLGKGTDFALFAFRGDRTVHSKTVRHHLGVRRLRFATPEELMTLTSLKPGCVPPFGAPVFDLPLYLDAQITSHRQVAFSLGCHTASVAMTTEAYLHAARATEIFSFSHPPDDPSQPHPSSIDPSR